MIPAKGTSGFLRNEEGVRNQCRAAERDEIAHTVHVDSLGRIVFLVRTRFHGCVPWLEKNRWEIRRVDDIAGVVWGSK